MLINIPLRVLFICELFVDRVQLQFHELLIRRAFRLKYSVDNNRSNFKKKYFRMQLLRNYA